MSARNVPKSNVSLAGDVARAGATLAGTLPPREVAEQLGIGRSTLTDWLHKGLVPNQFIHRTLGGRWRLDPKVIPALREMMQGLPKDARSLKRLAESTDS